MSARKILSSKEAAPYIGIAYSTMCKWRCQGRGPSFVLVGPRRIGYLIEELDRWLASRVRHSTSDRRDDDRGDHDGDRT